MKLDKLNIIIILLSIVIIVLLFQNRKMNQRLSNLENKIEDAANFSESASEYARQASENSFGNVCGECPEDVRSY